MPIQPDETLESQDTKAEGTELSLSPNSIVNLGPASTVIVGLSWKSSTDLDLDVSACLFGSDGNFLESVYFGNLSSEDGSVTHTGDARKSTSEGADEEELLVRLQKIASNVSAIVFTVTSYSGESLDQVQSASLRISTSDGKKKSRVSEVGVFPLPTFSTPTATKENNRVTGVVTGKLYRNPSTGAWQFHTLGNSYPGRSFSELLPQMQKSLLDIIPDIKIQEIPIVVLTKGETISLKLEKLSTEKTAGTNFLTSCSQAYIGLGWDMKTTEQVDLDASCLCFDRKNNMVDVVFFNKLTNENKSIRHAGDNLTGAGEGDDETIYLNLDEIPNNISYLFFTVNSYSKQPFSLIKNAYVRFVQCQKGTDTEIIRFQLNGAGSPEDTSLIMSKLIRSDGIWKMKAVGYGSKGNTYQDNIKDCQKELAGALVDERGFKYTPYIAPSGSSKLKTSVKVENNNNVYFLGAIILLLLAWILFNLL